MAFYFPVNALINNTVRRKNYFQTLMAESHKEPPSSFPAGFGLFSGLNDLCSQMAGMSPASRVTRHRKALPSCWRPAGREPGGSMCGGAAACQSNDMWSQCAVTTVSPVGLSGQQASVEKITGDQYRFFHLTIFGSLSHMPYHPCVPAYLALLMSSCKLRHGRY